MLLCLLVLQNTLSRRGQVVSLSTVNLAESILSFLSTWDPTLPCDIFLSATNTKLSLESDTNLIDMMSNIAVVGVWCKKLYPEIFNME